MIGKILILTLTCFALIQANPRDSPYFQECETEIKPLNQTQQQKMPCMMACIAFKSKMLNSDYSMDPDKKIEWAKEHIKDTDRLKTVTEAIEKCQDAGKGSTDYCTAGTKIHDCMTANGAGWQGGHSHGQGQGEGQGQGQGQNQG